MGYHRLLTHRSFQTPKLVEHLLAVRLLGLVGLARRIQVPAGVPAGPALAANRVRE
jgi:hypothetical protein